MISGTLERGLLSSAQRQAVTFADSKIPRQASRIAIPHITRAGILSNTPDSSADLNSPALRTSPLLRLPQDSSNDAISRLLVETKYGVSDARRTFAGIDRGLPLLRVRTNKN